MKRKNKSEKNTFWIEPYNIVKVYNAAIVAYAKGKNVNKVVYYGLYDNEQTAAHASDTLARQLMKNGELNLKLNFPDDNTEVHRIEVTVPEDVKQKRLTKLFHVSIQK